MLKSKRAPDGTKLYACWAGNADPDVNDPTIWHTVAEWNEMLDETRASIAEDKLASVYEAMARDTATGPSLKGFAAADIEGFYAELKAQADAKAAPEPRADAEPTAKFASLDDLAREVYGRAGS